MFPCVAPIDMSDWANSLKPSPKNAIKFKKIQQYFKILMIVAVVILKGFLNQILIKTINWFLTHIYQLIHYWFFVLIYYV